MSDSDYEDKAKPAQAKRAEADVSGAVRALSTWIVRIVGGDQSKITTAGEGNYLLSLYLILIQSD